MNKYPITYFFYSSYFIFRQLGWVFYASKCLSLELLIWNQQVGAKCNLELIMLKCTNGVKYIFASVADNTGAQWVSGDRKNRRISPGPLIGLLGGILTYHWLEISWVLRPISGDDMESVLELLSILY